MNVNELHALTQQLADVEVFDQVPYRFDGKPLFATYLNEAVESIVSASRR